MSNSRYLLAGIAGLALQSYAVLGMAHSAPEVEVVATGLQSPRGLDFAPNGELYVAETGTWVQDVCTQTGLISRIDLYKDTDHARVPVLTGLPNYGDVGPADISFFGMQGFVVIGLAKDPIVRAAATCVKKDLLGSVIRMNPSQGYKYVADISEFERSYNHGAGNPDNGLACSVPGMGPCTGTMVPSFDTNPFGILAEPGRLVVSDAGANDLIEVGANGKKRLLGIFPAEGSDRVPSRVTRGPDGYLYVGEEAFGAGIGQARIYRVPPNGCQDIDSCPVYKTGFTSIMDLEFDQAGNLYVLEYASFSAPTPEEPNPGNKLIKIDRKGNQTILADKADGLDGPGGLVLSADGRYAYVSNRANCYGKIYAGFGNSLSCVDPNGPQPDPAHPEESIGKPGLYGEVLSIRLRDHRRW